MKWEKVRLGDCCEIIDGDRGKNYPQQNEFHDTGYCLFLDAGNVTKTGFSFNSNHFITEEKCNILHNGKMQRGDIAYTTRGTVGNIAYFSESIPYQHIRINSGMVIIRVNKDVASAQFLYQLLKHNEYRTYFTQYCTGSAQPQLPIKNLSQIEIPLPPLPVQKKIAFVLSCYDDLIENCGKQIALLEEAATRLYRKWFVGKGEKAGWTVGTVGEIGCRIESGSRPKGGIDATLKEGIPSIGAENVIGLGQYNYSSEKLIPKAFFENMKRGKLKDKDILIYKDGAYIGKTSLFQDDFPHKEAAVNEHVFLLHTDNEALQYYMFFTLHQHEYYLKMQNLNKNSAQPGINSTAIKSLDILIPDMNTIEAFDKLVTPIMKNIFAKAKQISLLAAARDLCLPRLMSGRGCDSDK